MASRRKGSSRAIAAVLLSKKDYRDFVKGAADLQTALCAARDLVLQLRELLLVKRKRSDAARKANETRQTILDVRQPDNGQPGGSQL